MNVQLSPNQRAILARIAANGSVIVHASDLRSINVLVSKNLVRIVPRKHVMDVDRAVLRASKIN